MKEIPGRTDNQNMPDLWTMIDKNKMTLYPIGWPHLFEPVKAIRSEIIIGKSASDYARSDEMKALLQK